jgi:hypothetical protein
MVQNQFFPPWDKVKADHVEPGIRHIITVLGNELTDLEQNVKPNWSSLVEPLERISDRMSRAWGIVSHLKAVKDCPELREAVEAVQGERVKLSLRMSQSKPLYEAFQALRDGEVWGTLSKMQQRIVESELRDFVLGGVALEGQVCYFLLCNLLVYYVVNYANSPAWSAAVVLLSTPGWITWCPQPNIQLAMHFWGDVCPAIALWDGSVPCMRCTNLTRCATELS